MKKGTEMYRVSLSKVSEMDSEKEKEDDIDIEIDNDNDNDELENEFNGDELINEFDSRRNIKIDNKKELKSRNKISASNFECNKIKTKKKNEVDNIIDQIEENDAINSKLKNSLDINEENLKKIDKLSTKKYIRIKKQKTIETKKIEEPISSNKLYK